ncbi:MAG: type III secretion inner membrane ring lipoprotein SctJ [Nitratireductor sp.]|nr:type III secretion inner membrane ring lipoprotein SctJ [Nitratireductor sp.]MCB1457722.1 type III secretion inner membrane ring lipoprotein SctJ [Nitratireductor sp.]
MTHQEKHFGAGWRKAVAGIAIAGTLLLGGCQAELYSNLQERDVKEMLTVLESAGIDANVSGSEEGKFAIQVDRDKLSKAITELSRNGLPRQKYGSIGEVFAGDKLVSTPFEERARFMYALNQEMADSLTRISGIVSARVHLMMPESTPFDKAKTEPRAAVFIYKKPGSDLSSLVPVVKNLIVNSLDGLKYENVEVAMFDAAFAENEQRTVWPSLGNLTTSLFMLVVLFGALVFGVRLLRKAKANEVGGSVTGGRILAPGE